MESNMSSGLTWQWPEVLDKLIQIVSDPVVQSLQKNTPFVSTGLTRHCCHLLARVIAELVHQCSTTEVTEILNISNEMNIIILVFSCRKISKMLVEEFYI